MRPLIVDLFQYFEHTWQTLQSETDFAVLITVKILKIGTP